MKEDQEWMPIKAEQYFNVDSVEFIWIAKVKVAPLVSIYAKDELIDGKGNLVVIGIIKVADANGYEVDNGEILAECTWFPSVFLNDYINWEVIDNSSAKATINHNGITASAIFHFNERGGSDKDNGKEI